MVKITEKPDNSLNIEGGFKHLSEKYVANACKCTEPESHCPASQKMGLP
jgi:hypothetical protein